MKLTFNTCMKASLAIVFATAFASTLCAGADWPQWRGAARNGISAERVQWPKGGVTVDWRGMVGTGFASIAVSQGRVYTMGNSNNTDMVWCLDAKSGERVWRYDYPSRLDPQYYEGGPGATPTVHDGRVYTLSKWGTVLCLDAENGALQWRHDLWQEGIRSNRWGFAGSPLVWEDLLILNAGTAGTALDLKSGRVAWSSGTNVAGYASPVLCRLAGKEVVLIFAQDFLAAVDPRSGREFWRRPFKTTYDTNNADPLVWDDWVLISSFTRGAELLRVSSTQAAPEVSRASKDLKMHLSPGVKMGEYLYAFHGEAKSKTDLRCLHLPTLEVRWRRDNPAFGTMIMASDLTLILSEKGELIGGKATPEGFEELGRTKILEPVCWTPPALSDGALYARNARGDIVRVNLGGSQLSK